jgi:DNA-directed RNA polymerase subunit F
MHKLLLINFHSIARSVGGRWGVASAREISVSTYDQDLSVEEEEEVVEPPRSAAVLSAQESAAVKPVWVLKKLSHKHKNMLQMKHAGLSRIDIGKACDCVPEYITKLMTQQVAIDYMNELMRQTDEDLTHLTQQAVEHVGKAMNSGDEKVGLRAAELVLKANGKLSEKEYNQAVTAEDVVAKLFAIHNSNVQINITQKE